jgi:CheY-like chemotaxis protein
MEWDLKNLAAVLEGISKVAWPLLAIYVLWLFYPAVMRVIESRGFKVKVGEMEVTVQDVSDQLANQVADLQKKVEELRRQLGQVRASDAAPPAVSPQWPPAALPEAAPPAVVPTPAQPGIEPPAVPFAPAPRRILWVDDVPANVAFQVARLRTEGIEVVEAKTTEEALREASHLPFALVITDMGRSESGSFHARAGLELISALRAAGSRLPVYVFSSARYLERYREDVLRSEGNGATSSPVELFEMIHRVIGHPA